METISINIPRAEARGLYREYKKHQHYSTPEDHEIRRAYQLLAQGRLIIKAIESVKAAGVNDAGLPKLALCRADARACRWSVPWSGGAGMMTFEDDPSRSSRWNTPTAADKSFVFRGWEAIRPSRQNQWLAAVPPVPLHLRPKRGLANYHILWEAEWERVPPRDPYLLRRIGKSDLWLVVAMWDLTEVERGVLAARLANA
jgi:hypothetical protein